MTDVRHTRNRWVQARDDGVAGLYDRARAWSMISLPWDLRRRLPPILPHIAIGDVWQQLIAELEYHRRFG